MKIFVIGANGMVGHVIALFLQEQGHTVLGYDAGKSILVKNVIGSLYDTNKIEKLVNDLKFDAIINCAAVINQNAEEDKAAASFVNTYLPHFLEKITKNTKTKVIHRSTDCIFSGKKGQYKLTDKPDADSFYARTKAVGELINEKDITIRTSLIGPELDIKGQGLFNWYMSQKGSVNGYANSIWTGITTIEFAKEVERLLEQQAYGLFQCVPNCAISKYELLCLFAKQFPGHSTVNKLDNKLVDKSLIQALGNYRLEIHNYDTMIMEMKKWIFEHQNLYKY